MVLQQGALAAVRFKQGSGEVSPPFAIRLLQALICAQVHELYGCTGVGIDGSCATLGSQLHRWCVWSNTRATSLRSSCYNVVQRECTFPPSTKQGRPTFRF